MISTMLAGISIEVDEFNRVISLDGKRMSLEFLDALNEAAKTPGGVVYRLGQMPDGVVIFQRDPAGQFWARVADTLAPKPTLTTRATRGEQDAFQAGYNAGVEVGAEAEAMRIQRFLETNLEKLAFQQIVLLWGGRNGSSANFKPLAALVDFVADFRVWLKNRSK